MKSTFVFLSALFLSFSAQAASPVLFAFEGHYGKGELQVQVRANGEVVQRSGERESLLATLDQALVERFAAAIDAIDPALELRELFAKEPREKDCRGDYTEVAVYGRKFEGGRKVILQSVGCTGTSRSLDEAGEAGRQASWRIRTLAAFLAGFQQAQALW